MSYIKREKKVNLNKSLKDKYVKKINDSSTLKELSSVKSFFFGKNGFFNVFFLSIKSLPTDIKIEKFKELNIFKDECLNIIKKRKFYLESLQHIENIQFFDVTLPEKRYCFGSLHPINLIIQQIKEFFSKIGFTCIYGSDVEDEYHNFDLLNIKKFHLARKIQDTFYLANNLLLRTHTSALQIRVMENNSPPFNLFSVGRVYRVDSDITHTPMFHQLEVLSVNTCTSFASLKWLLVKFLNVFFPNIQVRFRYSYFPFTEPSAEVDIYCFNCSNGCFLCKYTGWIELLGCGMVHPLVLRNCKLNYKKYTGFAFGVGIDRLAMLKYGITDLRINFENDLRFLSQFK